MSSDTYVPLALTSPMRDGQRRGEFTFDGHVISVATQAVQSGKFVNVRACSATHPALGPVLAHIGTLRKVGVGRYDVSGHCVDRGTVNDLAERLVRYALEA